MKRWTFPMGSVRKCDGLNYENNHFICDRLHRLAKLASSDLSVRCLVHRLPYYFARCQEFRQSVILSRSVPVRYYLGTAAAGRHIGRCRKGYHLFSDTAMARAVESKGMHARWRLYSNRCVLFKFSTSVKLFVLFYFCFAYFSQSHFYLSRRK